MSEPAAPGGPTYNQTYEKVGSVYNANQIVFAGGAGDEPIPERATLAATMLDRGPQSNEILERLAAHEPHEGHAAIAVLHGCNADLHDAFVLRCARIDFVDSLAGGGAWRHLQRLPWPDGGGGVEAILRPLRDRLGLPKALPKAETEAQVAKIAGNICFSHLIDEAAWKADQGALVRAWVDYIASGALRPAPGFRLVAFLCLADDEARAPGLLGRLFGGKRVDFGAFVAGLRTGGPAPGVIPLPQLDVIRPKHVGEWVGEAVRYLRDEPIEGQFLTLSNKVFGEMDDRRFDYVFDVLQKELARAMRPRSAFVELNR